MAERSSPDPAVVDAILEHVRDSLERQIAAGESLDKKAFQLFGVASLVVGLVAAGGGASNLSPWVLAPALFAYVIAAVTTIAAVWTREFRVARHADTVWNTHWDSSPEIFAWATIEDIASGYDVNRGYLRAKAEPLTVCFCAVAVEVILVGVALVLKSL